MLVEPKVFMIGCTVALRDGMEDYLRATGQVEFLSVIEAAYNEGISPAEALVSFFAKLCYKSLVVGKNLNITQTRDIEDNLKGTHDQGHGSVWEHCVINFVATDVSRVLTHELVRHRAGWAYSQTSGRYVRGDSLDLVFDPILEPVRNEIEMAVYQIQENYKALVKMMGLDTMTDKDLKKKITSALRRILPNGQSNEIGFSVNLRALRHFVMVRTSRHAEWEIRSVAEQVYDLVNAEFPLVFYGAKEEVVGGIKEITGMKLQPYEKSSD